MAKKPIKKYQTQSTVEKARNAVAGIKANTKKKPTTSSQYTRDFIAAAERSLLTPNRVDYLGDNRKPFSVKDAVRIAVEKGENDAKFTRAAHPSDVLGKPKYLKKEMKGGTIKKKK